LHCEKRESQFKDVRRLVKALEGFKIEIGICVKAESRYEEVPRLLKGP
jgi:hypothetical protein